MKLFVAEKFGFKCLFGLTGDIIYEITNVYHARKSLDPLLDTLDPLTDEEEDLVTRRMPHISYINPDRKLETTH